MFCKNCGKELSGNAYICPDCGEPVETVKSASPEGAVKPQKSVLPLLGLVTTIISFVFAVFYLTCNMLTFFEYGFFNLGASITASVTTGIITNLIAFVGLFLGIVGLHNSNANGNATGKAFSLTGVIVCSIILAALISCYCAVAIAS